MSKKTDSIVRALRCGPRALALQAVEHADGVAAQTDSVSHRRNGSVVVSAAARQCRRREWRARDAHCSTIVLA
jgi:hypothetical protein